MLILTRRHLMAWALAAPDASQSLSALEKKSGGRLGVCALDTANGRQAGHRQNERFAMCSTFKLPLAAVVLRESARGRLRLDEELPYSKADLLPNSPVTAANVAQGRMTIEALARATQTTSDNAAANLLLRRLGGPAAFTALLRKAGDRLTRLDRFETQMNLVHAGELQDTTTPAAMAATVARFLTGPSLLAPELKQKLAGWMEETQTGLKRIRGGLPAGWRAGDKTGTALMEGYTDKYNDVALIWPPGRAPVAVAVYYDTGRSSKEMRDEDQAVLAEAGRIAANWITS